MVDTHLARRIGDRLESIGMKSKTEFLQAVDAVNTGGRTNYFGFIGIVITDLGEGSCTGELVIRSDFDGPPGFIHAGAIVSLADSCAGAGCANNLPEGATGFTTVELKTNLLGSVGEGTLICQATAAHMGRTTQVWDAIVFHKESGRKLALFRCTQMVLYPKPA